MEWEWNTNGKWRSRHHRLRANPSTRLVGAPRDVRDAMKSLHFRIAFLMRFVAVEQRLVISGNNIALEDMLCVLGLLWTHWFLMLPDLFVHRKFPSITSFAFIHEFSMRFCCLDFLLS